MKAAAGFSRNFYPTLKHPSCATNKLALDAHALDFYYDGTMSMSNIF